MKSKLGSNLKSLRLLHGYSFKALEKLINERGCNITASTLQRYEVGKIPNVPYDSIIALSELYQVSPCVLMGWESGLFLTDAEMNLVEDFRNLNSAGQTAAAATIKSFTQMDVYAKKAKEKETG